MVLGRWGGCSRCFKLVSVVDWWLAFCGCVELVVVGICFSWWYLFFEMVLGGGFGWLSSLVLGFDCVELQWGWFGFGLIWGGCGGFLAISVRCGVGIIRILWVLWFRASGFVLFCVLVLYSGV